MKNFILKLSIITASLTPLLAKAIDIQYPITGEETGLVEIVKNIYQFGLAIVGITAFAMIISGGITYFLSAGNVTNANKGKERIYNAILGLVIIAGSYLILYTINPDFVKLTEPELPTISLQPADQSMPNAWACALDDKTQYCALTEEECNLGSGKNPRTCPVPCVYQNYCSPGTSQFTGCQPISLIFDPAEIKTSEYATMKATFKQQKENACQDASATFVVRKKNCNIYIEKCDETNYNFVNNDIKCAGGENCTAVGLMEIYEAGTYTASVVAKKSGQQSAALESSPNLLIVKGAPMYACRQPRSSTEKEKGLQDKILECYIIESDCTQECPTLGEKAYCDNGENRTIKSCQPTLCKINTIDLKNQSNICGIQQVVQNKHVVSVVANASQCLPDGDWNAKLQIIKVNVKVGDKGPEFSFKNYGSPITTQFNNNRASFLLESFKDLGQYYVQIKTIKTENNQEKIYDLLDYFNKPIYVVASSICENAME